MTQMRVLIIGGSGFLGSELVRQAAAAGAEVVATYASGPGSSGNAHWRALDIRDRVAVRTLIKTVRPDSVINTAYRKDDWASTADGAGNVAAAAGARLVHVSSDAVFSGKAVRYVETAVPDPIFAYGAAKAAAETAVRTVAPDAAVARTSLIFGAGSHFERLVQSVATGQSEAVFFTDDVRCPVHVADLAAALLELAHSDLAGTFHVAGADALNRFEQALLIADRYRLDVTRLLPGLRAESNAPGPLDVRLDNTWTQQHLRTKLRGAREFLQDLI